MSFKEFLGKYYKLKLNKLNLWILLFQLSVKRSLKNFHCITSVACAIGPSVTTSSTDFLPKPGFWNLFEFSAPKIL